jgi:hypothetical protein
MFKSMVENSSGPIEHRFPRTGIDSRPAWKWYDRQLLITANLNSNLAVSDRYMHPLTPVGGTNGFPM